MSLISAASFGCIDRLEAIRNSASVGALIGGAAGEGGAAISAAAGMRCPDDAGLSPSFFNTSIGVPG